MPRSQLIWPVHQIVGKAAHQPRQVLQIILAPARKRVPRQPLASRVQHLRHGPALVCDDRLGDATVSPARPPSDEAETFQFRHLPADGRVVAADPVRQFAYPERSAALG